MLIMCHKNKDDISFFQPNTQCYMHGEWVKMSLSENFETFWFLIIVILFQSALMCAGMFSHSASFIFYGL